MSVAHLSPLRYPGGKTKFTDLITDILQTNHLIGHAYAEPYAGGAGAALCLLKKGVVSEIHINDKDPAIYAIWHSILHHPQNFIEKIQTIDLTIDEWRNQKAILTASDTSNTFALGFAAFYLNRTNVSGVIKGGVIGGLDQLGKYTINSRFNRERLAAQVTWIHEQKDNIHLTNLDAFAFLKTLSRRKNIFYYIDPPYVHKAASLYLNVYQKSDHQALRDLLLSQAWGKKNWLLSYDNCPEVLALYADHEHKSEYSVHHSLANNGTKQEFLAVSNHLTLTSTHPIR